jgi:hypothetical protein
MSSSDFPGPLARELALFREAFSFRSTAPPDARSFTLHERSGYGGVLVALFLAVLVESGVTHLLVAPAHPLLAALLLVLGVYSAVWFLGDYQAIRRRPSRLDGDELTLRLGLRKQLRVRRAELRSLEPLPGGVEPTRDTGYARFTPFGAPELLLRFHHPVRLEEMYKPPREVSALGLTLDDEAAFRAALGW